MTTPNNTVAGLAERPKLTMRLSELPGWIERVIQDIENPVFNYSPAAIANALRQMLRTLAETQQDDAALASPAPSTGVGVEPVLRLQIVDGIVKREWAVNSESGLKTLPAGTHFLYAAAPSGVRVDDAFVRKILAAPLGETTIGNMVCTEVTADRLIPALRAALTAALSANEVSRG